MQKDIRSTDKGETTNTKEGDKLRQVGHDVNASLKENVGVGVGNYSSGVDREKSRMHEQSYDLKKQREERDSPKLESRERRDWKEGERRDWKEGERKDDWKQSSERDLPPNNDDLTGAITHKAKEIGREINASLKQNVGIGVGNYSSEKDKEIASFHKDKYDEKIETTKQQVEEKKEQAKDKLHEGYTGKLTERAQQIGHDVNAVLKENIGIGVGDYPSEVDREKSKEHWENFQEKVKDDQKIEVGDSTSIGHKIREVAHNINANLKEMIGVGFGNYGSEVDRELATIHKEEYDKKAEDTPSETIKKDFNKVVNDLSEKKDNVKSELKDDKNKVKNDLSEKKDKVKNDLSEKKDKVKSELKDDKNKLKRDLNEKKEDVKSELKKSPPREKGENKL